MNLLLSQLPQLPVATDPLDIAPATTLPIATTETTPVDEEASLAFNDALLTIINTLTGGEQQRDTLMVQAGLDSDADDDEKPTHSSDDDVALQSVLPPAQQLLDTLLMASQMPVKTLEATHNAPQPGEALKMRSLATPAIQPQTTAQPPLQPQPLALTPVTPEPLPVTTQAADVLVKPVMTDAAKALVTSLPTATQPTTTQTFSVAMDKQTVHLPPVRLEGDESKWAQQLHSALSDRLQLQVRNQVQHATIRLDPPEMGKVEISLQIENGRMQVHINASNGETYRALQQVSNDLRQSLTEQNFVQVNVQVSSQSGQQQGRGQRAPESQDGPDAAATLPADDATFTTGKDDSVLLTV
jgi:flagellar hook-length control protein FliK